MLHPTTRDYTDYLYILHEGAKHPPNPLSHAVQEVPSKVDRVARLVRALVVNPRERRREEIQDAAVCHVAGRARVQKGPCGRKVPRTNL